MSLHCPVYEARGSSGLRPPPLGCSQRPVGGAGEPAGFCSMAGSIPEEGTRRSRVGTGKRIQGGVPGEGPGPGSKDRAQGGLQGRGPGSVEPGRATQDEGGILASLRASIASAGPGPSKRASERGRVDSGGLRLTGRSGWRTGCRCRGLTSSLLRRRTAGAENRCLAGPAPNE